MPTTLVLCGVTIHLSLFCLVTLQFYHPEKERIHSPIAGYEHQQSCIRSDKDLEVFISTIWKCYPKDENRMHRGTCSSWEDEVPCGRNLRCSSKQQPAWEWGLIQSRDIQPYNRMDVQLCPSWPQYCFISLRHRVDFKEWLCKTPGTGLLFPFIWEIWSSDSDVLSDNGVATVMHLKH